MDVSRIEYVLKGDRAAVECFLIIRDALHLWDDLIDGDKPVSRESIHTTFTNILVGLACNPFWRKHIDTLAAVLCNAIANWHAANSFETAPDINQRRLQVAFIIRSDYANLLITMARLVGGMAWCNQVTTLIRDEWTGEDFTKYLDNLAQEKAAREGEHHVL
jgi:hypothetical protein